MAIERNLWRGMFAPGEVVQLRQVCFTPGVMFQPGKYTASELPDVAFEMGLVERVAPVKGKDTQIEDSETPPESEP
jgi:hypothetical protein